MTIVGRLNLLRDRTGLTCLTLSALLAMAKNTPEPSAAEQVRQALANFHWMDVVAPRINPAHREHDPAFRDWVRGAGATLRGVVLMHVHFASRFSPDPQSIDEYGPRGNFGTVICRFSDIEAARQFPFR